MNRKLTFTGAALCTVALVLTGCADKKDDTAAPTTATTTVSVPPLAPTSKPPVDANGLPSSDIVKQAVIATRQLSAVHLKLNVDPAIVGLPVSKADARLQKGGEVRPGAAPGPMAARGTATVRINEKYVDTEFIVRDSVLYLRIPPADKFNPAGKGGDKDVYDPSVVLDNSKGLLNVLDNIENLKVIERQTLPGGVDTVKVTGTVSAKTLDPVLPNITEVIAKGGGDAGKVPVTVWVTDRKGDDTSKPLLAKLEVTMKDKPITLELSNFDEKVDISKPVS